MAYKCVHVKEECDGCGECQQQQEKIYCTSCGKELEDEYCYDWRGEPTCEDCYIDYALNVCRRKVDDYRSGG